MDAANLSRPEAREGPGFDQGLADAFGVANHPGPVTDPRLNFRPDGLQSKWTVWRQHAPRLNRL
jgi:hypothetical protein